MDVGLAPLTITPCCCEVVRLATGTRGGGPLVERDADEAPAPNEVEQLVFKTVLADVVPEPGTATLLLVLDDGCGPGLPLWNFMNFSSRNLHGVTPHCDIIG